MLHKLFNWNREKTVVCFPPTPVVETPTTSVVEVPEVPKNVVITQPMADQIIGELLENIDYMEEEHAGQIAHLEMLLKSIVLSNGGNITLSKDFVAMIVEGSYRVQILDKDGELQITLEQFDPEEEGCGDESCENCGHGEDE